MDRCILDSNILMYLFRGNSIVAQKVRQHVSLYKHLYITILTYYEVRMGWEYNVLSRDTKVRLRARQKLREFENFCFEHQVLPLTKDACNYAAQIYATRKRTGRGDFEAGFDLLIAGIALAGGFTIVTENVQDFSDISGLKVTNWLS